MLSRSSGSFSMMNELPDPEGQNADNEGDNLQSSELESDSSDSNSPVPEVYKTSKKRKRAEDASPPPRASRMKVLYNDEYRELYNATAAEAAARFDSEPLELLEASQLGACVWSAEEKELFFIAVAKLGKDDLPGISAAIRSKSELEVRDYMLLLQDALVEHNTIATNPPLLSLVDIPAAFELSPECCSMLDEAGEALAHRQSQYDKKQEKARFGKYWCIDQNLAEKIESCVAAKYKTRDLHGAENCGRENHETGVAEGLDQSLEAFEAVPAADLLHVGNILHVAIQIQMGYGESRPETRSDLATEQVEVPAIFHTALEELHALTVFTARKLVHTTIFAALSRLRADTKDTSKERARVIRSQDVHTAATLLNMEFRRTGLHQDQTQESRLTSDAESQGCPSEDTVTDSTDSAESRLSKNRATYASTKRSELGLDPSSQRSSRNRLNAFRFSSTQIDGERENEDHSNEGPEEGLLELEEDRYAEEVDRRESCAEEMRIWELLGYRTPTLEVPPPEPTFPNPKKRHVGIVDMKNWRDELDYRAEWEGMGNALLSEPVRTATENSSFEGNERLRRRGKSKRSIRPRKRRGATTGPSSTEFRPGLQEEPEEPEEPEDRPSASSRLDSSSGAGADSPGEPDRASPTEAYESDQAPQRVSLPRRASETARAFSDLLPEMPLGAVSSGDDYSPEAAADSNSDS